MLHAVTRAYYRWIQPRTSVSIRGLSGTFVTDTPVLYRRVIRFGGEKTQLEGFLAELRPGDVVWDVGAYVGTFSLFAAKAVGPSGRVYAFEPEAAAAELLRRNIALNRAGNVVTMHVALGDADGSGELFSAAEGSKAIHSLRPGKALAGKGAAIPLRRGDSLVKNAEAVTPNVIKMDIEGAELLALSGLKETLARPACRFVFLELHHRDLPRFGASPRDVAALLESAGFEMRRRVERGTESHLFLYKKE